MRYRDLIAAATMAIGTEQSIAGNTYEPPQLSQESIVAFCKQANSVLVLDGKDVCEPIQASKTTIIPPVTSIVAPSTVMLPNIDVAQIAKTEETTKKNELLNGLGISLVITGLLGGAYLLNQKRENNQEKKKEAILNMLKELGIDIENERKDALKYSLSFTIVAPRATNGQADSKYVIGILDSGKLYVDQVAPFFSRLDNMGEWQNTRKKSNPSIRVIKETFLRILNSHTESNSDYNQTYKNFTTAAPEIIPTVEFDRSAMQKKYPDIKDPNIFDAWTPRPIIHRIDDAEENFDTTG